MNFLKRKRGSQTEHPSLTRVEEGLQNPERSEENHAKAQSTNDDSDNNDRFWKLFLKEGTAEAQYQVTIWKTELDSLLVFAGLFAAVVSAFLVDLRSRLSPDPLVTRQVIALMEIVALLRQETSPTDSDLDKPPSAVFIAGYLWYASLVVTLLGALAGVLAQRWLAALLREHPKNAADQALERWRRDKAARYWYMGNVITGVPLLTQIALALFLLGFVFQSLDDNRAVGIEVGVLVGLGLFAYAGVTLLPWFRPDCPFQTPITQLLHLIHTKETHDTDTGSKIEILASRFTRSSNDETFCAAASMLDVKLEGDDSEKWYNGVNQPTFASALSARLVSFAHRVQTMMAEESPLSILQNSASSGANEDTFVRTLSSPMEQGIICLRVLLRSIEASVSAPSSAWINQDINSQWKLSKAFPEAWRLLSWSIDITKLVVKKLDYDRNDIVTIDWDNMIRKTFTDRTLRSIVGASICRGLREGKENVKGVCALGLAMFIEMDATSIESSKLSFSDEKFAAEKGKVIIGYLWSELVNVWNNTMDPALFQAKRFEKLVDHDIYRPGIKSTIQTIIEQLEHGNWQLREQAAQILVKLSEFDTFQKIANIEGIIPKLVAKLTDRDVDVRVAVVAALQTFSSYRIYQSDIESSIPTIVAQLDINYRGIRSQTTKLVVKLSEIEVFRQTLKDAGTIDKLVTRLKDNEPDVRAAIVTALQVFSGYELYRPDIESSIPSIIMQLDNKRREIRLQMLDLVVNLSKIDLFRQKFKVIGTIAKLVMSLKDDDSDVRAAIVEALQEFSNYELYQPDIESTIPTIIGQLADDEWEIRLQTVNLIVKLSEIDVFRQKLKVVGVVTKLIAKLEDDDSDVRTAIFAALQVFSDYELFQSDLEASIPTIIGKLDNDYWETRLQTVNCIVKLSETDMYRQKLQITGIIARLAAKLEDTDLHVCTAVIRALQVFSNYELYQSELENFIIAKLVTKLTNKTRDIRIEVVTVLQAFSHYELYQSDILSIIPNIIGQFDDDDWEIRLQSINLVVKFSEIDLFRQRLKIEGTIAKLITKLEENHSDVRAAIITALQVFSHYELYQPEIESSIPTIIGQLENDRWTIRLQTVNLVMTLSKIDVFRLKLKTVGTINKLVIRLKDNDSDVRAAIVAALQVFSNYELYQPDIESSIPSMITQLDNVRWTIRMQTVNWIVKLSEIDVFRQKLQIAEIISKLVSKLEDNDSDVCAAVIRALQALSHYELYQSDIKSSIPIIIKRLDHGSWFIRQRVVEMLANLSTYDVYHEAIIDSGVIGKLIAKFTSDEDEDVRTTTVQSMITLGTQSYFMSTMISEKAVSHLVDRVLYDSDYDVRSATIKGISALSKHEAYSDDINTQFLTQIPTIVEKLKAESQTDRQVSIEILTEFATNEMFRKALKSEKAIPQLAANLADTFDSIRSAVQSIVLSLSTQEFYQDDIKSTIPVIMKHLEGQNSATRQQAIQILVKLYNYPIFQEVLQAEGLVKKVIASLEDTNEDVRYEALQALSALGTKKGLLKELVAVIPELVAKLQETDGEVRSSVPYNALLILGKPANSTTSSRAIVSTLNNLEKPVRIEAYKLLTELKDLKASSTDELPSFLNDIDAAICEILTEIKDQEMSAIYRAIAILAETAEKGLTGENLKTRGPINKSARDTVETVVRSKLVYDKNSPDRNEVVLALSRLAKHEIFRGCLKPAIPGLIEALGNNDWNIWSAAVGALSALSGDDEFRKPLAPALTKLIQQLSRWDEDEDYSLNLTSNSQIISLTEDLLTLVANFKTSGHLTMNNRIALASSLHIASRVPTSLEIRVCKLELAALLRPTDASTDTDGHTFFSALFGNVNDSFRSKLSTLFPTPTA